MKKILYISLILISFAGGYSFRGDTIVKVTETVNKAPIECKKVLDIDTNIFAMTSQSMETYDFKGVTSYTNSITKERDYLYAVCMNAI